MRMLVVLGFLGFAAAPVSAAESPDTTKSVTAFKQALKVFRHPRCLNCHPAADHPTQGDDLHAHIMNIQRGPDDHGAVGQKCLACHTDANYEAAKVPGAPKWALAPRSMGWQGMSDRELCELLKDRKRNGDRSLSQIVDHSANDPLVAWGWRPGAARQPVPGSQAEFGRNVAEWVEFGAKCP